MARTTSFTKRSLIGKANSTMVIATSVAAFVLVFTLVAGKALLSQMAYQNRVINEKEKALTQLKADVAAVDSLKSSYRSFVNENPNVLAGDPNGTGPQDGDNAKIILDALPSKYDFPALTTSLEYLITSQNLQIMGISGTDDEVTQQQQQASAEPVPIAMPFQVQVNGAYAGIQGLIDLMDRSIRPFQIQTMELSGDESSMIANITAQSFYQPEKSLTIEEEVVK
jgi:hypothetical protein